MLLKVEVYPFQGEAYTGPPQRTPDTTVHVCLATSTSGNEGRLLTVGRKVGDITLTKDKSVSREHCIVRMVTTNKTLPTSSSSSSSGNNKSNNQTSTPLPARTPEEQKACQASSFYQCSVVLESVGKLGTFIVEEVPATASARRSTTTTGDDSDTDEEADMMIISQPAAAAASQQASQLPMSSWIRTLVLGSEDAASDNARLIRSRLVAQSSILTELNANHHGRVVILCGKQESIVVLTRVPINVQRTKSSFDKATVPPWWSELYAAGVVDLSDSLAPSQMLSPQTTHVIASKRSSTHRQLCAWLHQIPIVQAEYLQALLQRKAPSDPLPDENNYLTPYPNSKDSFWMHPPKPNVWTGLTYVSMKREDDWVDVVKAMGGSVCRLYEEIQKKKSRKNSKHSNKNDDSSDDDEDEEEEQAMSQQCLAAFDSSCTWSVDLKARRYTKPLRDANIPLFSAKDVALAVTTSQVLPGLTPPITAAAAAPPAPKSQTTTTTSSGRLETQSVKTRRTTRSRTDANGTTSPVQSTASVKAHVQDDDATPTKSSAASPKDTDKSNDKPVVSSTPVTKTAMKRSTTKPASSPDDSAHENKASTARQTRKTRAKTSPDSSDSENEINGRQKVRQSRTSPRGKGSETTPVAKPKSSRQSARSKTGNVEDTTTTIVNEPPLKDMEDEDMPPINNDHSMQTETPEKKEEKSKQDDDQGKQYKREAPAADRSAREERPSKRKKLETTSNGWLQAAPSNPQKRRAHIRTKEEILEAYGGDKDDLYVEPAAIEWAPKSVPTAPSSTQQRHRRRDTGPNFKAFRKNSVPPIQIVDYKWKSHKAFPVAQQAQFEEEKREADEQYRLANQLFQDDTTSKGRRRRLQ